MNEPYFHKLSGAVAILILMGATPLCPADEPKQQPWDEFGVFMSQGHQEGSGDTAFVQRLAG